MADIIKSVANSKIPLPIPNPTHAAQAFDNLVNAWKECSIITEHEKTKRAEIKAFRDTNIKAIEENSALLKLYPRVAKNLAVQGEDVSGSIPYFS